jgi:thioredoxin-related protein
MKMLLNALFCLLLVTNINAQSESVWLTNFEEAKTLAAKENKQMMVSYSGSDWCRNCIRLDKQLFTDTAFSKYAAEHLVLVKLDFPMSKKNKLSNDQQAYNEKLAERYNPKGVFPLVLLFKGDSQIGKMNTNLPSAKDYIKELKGMSK